jgi:hypothetical protein
MVDSGVMGRVYFEEVQGASKQGAGCKQGLSCVGEFYFVFLFFFRF